MTRTSTALESGLEWASEYYYRKHKVELYCKPGNIELPASELRKIINKTISSKPDSSRITKMNP
jgi:hypothetical protein